MYKVPPYSQFLDVQDKKWKHRACGIVSLKMVMDFWANKTKKEYPVIDDLIKKFHHSAYIKNVGWSHKNLVEIAKKNGLNGKNLDWSELKSIYAMERLKIKLGTSPVIASVHKNFNPKLSGHLVVITGIKNGKIYYNDPAHRKRGTIRRTSSLKQFLKGWKKRIIVIQPRC